MDSVKMNPLHWFRRRKRPGRVTPSEQAAMQEAWLSGDTITAIAERMRRTPRTVRRALEADNDSLPTEAEAADVPDKTDSPDVEARAGSADSEQPPEPVQADSLFDSDLEDFANIGKFDTGVLASGAEDLDALTPENVEDLLSPDAAQLEKLINSDDPITEIPDKE